MTCKDCIHYERCNKIHNPNNKYSFIMYFGTAHAEIECDDFKNKFDYKKVEHGHWIWDTEEKYFCSVCQSKTRVDECMEKPVCKICPNGGAKMDLEGEK